MRKPKDILLTENINIKYVGGNFKVPKGKILRVKVLEVSK